MAGGTAQVVAHRPGQNTMRLWVDRGSGAGPAWLRVVSDPGGEVDRWSPQDVEVAPAVLYEDGVTGASFPGVHVRDVAGLEPGTAFWVEDDRGTRLATFRTLPDRLPLTIAVGSCYSVDDDHVPALARTPSAPFVRFRAVRRIFRGLTAKFRALTVPIRRDEDEAGGVASRYRALAGALDEKGRPIDVKVLLGDQVYVDQPPRDYYRPRDAEEARALVASRYQATWRRLGPLLSCGANICVSEDHEYWNNYPRPPFWLWRWSSEELDGLRTAAHEHRMVFQQTPVVAELGVGIGPTVEVFVADTRCARTTPRDDGGEFMDGLAFTRLLAWIGELGGPGVLVLGQPLLAAPGTAWKDTTLANYPAQHTPLCEAISASEHDIVVVCGDVHYGRYSVVPLASGRHLVEVVSSPMALLASAGSPPVVAEAPAALAVEGHVCSRFLRHTRPDGVGEDHITLLRFTATEDGVALEVTPYYTRFSDARGVPRQAASWAPIVLR